MSTIRPPAVAGMFYPADPRQLAHDVQKFLAVAHPFDLIPKALIAPHAGYVYSGAIAATAYETLRPSPHISGACVLCCRPHPSRSGARFGTAWCGCFRHPAGTDHADTAAAHAIAHLPQVSISAEVHAQEHSLEVQLPFLQTSAVRFYPATGWQSAWRCLKKLQRY